MNGNENGDDKGWLRRADIVTSVVLIGLGIFIIAEAFTMPMQASYGGVDNVWYVSPALFPIIVGAALALLGLWLGLSAIAELGRHKVVAFFRGLVRREQKGPVSAKSLRVIVIVVLLLIYVYMNVPRVDFFLSTWLFLLVFISAYYYDDDEIFKKLIGFYLAGTLLFFIYFAVGAHEVFTSGFSYFTDVLILLFIIAYAVYARVKAGADSRLKRRYRISMITAVTVPLVLVPVFKFFLLIPLPVEGGIITVMSLIRYSVFG